MGIALAALDLGDEIIHQSELVRVGSAQVISAERGVVGEAIADRTNSRRERLDILEGGEVTATLLPRAAVAVEDARRVMRERLTAPDWEFTGGTAMARDERNARG
jgi:hypothetical protein